jgi:Protein of unknown function (DUF2442)
MASITGWIIRLEMNKVAAETLSFEGDTVLVELSDGREMKLPIAKISWLAWLYKASPEEREKWSLEPGGYAIYWDDLHDGIEVTHLLSIEPLV